jgi:DtxR family Mn-dependent transcriptional regulator
MALAKQVKLSASLEDYLEAIFNLSSENKVARSKDIAEELGVSRASVTGALRTLSGRKLVNYKPYGFATLTEAVGVEDAVAQEAACRAEHALGPEIINRLLRFIEFVDSSGKGINITEQFKRFCDEAQLSEESLTD